MLFRLRTGDPLALSKAHIDVVNSQQYAEQAYFIAKPPFPRICQMFCEVASNCFSSSCAAISDAAVYTGLSPAESTIYYTDSFPAGIDPIEV